MEVLTETERSVKSKRGRFTAPLRCLLCDFTTQAAHDAGLDYEQQEQVWSDHSDSVHPLVRVNPELARLERAVIEAAKKWFEDFDFTGEFVNSSAISAHRRLRDAVTNLNGHEAGLESNQKESE